MIFARSQPPLLAVLLGLTALVADQSARAATPPNVLVVLADDMGFSDAGCYGGEIRTPHLDQLAAGGLRFTEFYNTARCWPTRAALLTGYYAQQVRRDTVPGIRSGGGGARPSWARLLPEHLKPLGYRNYHSGKWHVDGARLTQGFDRSYSIEDHNQYFHPQLHFEDDRKLDPVPAGSDYYLTTAIANHAIQCLQDHATRFPDRPFFQYLCFTAPHFPLHAPAEDIARYKETYQRGWDAIRQERWKRIRAMGLIQTAGGGGQTHELPPMEPDVGPPYHFPEALKGLGPAEITRPLPWEELADGQRVFQAAKMAVHAAMIDRMDRELGRVLDQIRSMGAWENTLIVFLSDNGASAEIMVRGGGHDTNAAPGSAASYLCLGPGWSSASNTPFRRHKTWVHEGGIATPLIVHWPAGIAARGELRRAPAHVIDLAPTILELAGGRWPDRWSGAKVPPSPGRSLVPLFERDGAAAHEFLWWLHEGNRAIRVGDFKLVAAGQEAPWELYDLSKDRGEINDLARTQPEKVRDLAALWAAKAKEFFALAREE